MRRFLPLLLLLATPLAAARADEVVLQGGSRVKGVVLERTPESVRVLLPRGDEVRLTAKDVARIVAEADAPAAGKYMQYREPDELGGGLEVAIAHFVHPDGGPRVDLVSAVHIADPGYFREVQRLLEAADVVLYEGIKAEDMSAADFQKAQPEDSPVRKTQRSMAKWFELAFQLEAIEYTRPHFVHADLTLEAFVKEGGASEEGNAADGANGSSGSPLGGGMAQIEKMLETVGPMIERMLSSAPARASFKKMFARLLGSTNVETALGMMPGMTELLLEKRNAVVIERLKEQREKAKGSIAVFYGAGHMRMLEHDLVETLGYRRAGGRWIRAWELGGK